MDIQQTTQTSLDAGTSVWNTTSKRIIGPWFFIIRVLWIVLILFNFVSFFVTIPAYYKQVLSVCTNPKQGCNFGQLTPGYVETLHRLTIPLNVYATYSLVLSILVSLIFLSMSILIYYYKSDEWIAVLASFVLLIFAVEGDVRFAALPSNSPLAFAWILVILVYSAQGLLFASFPNGRLVPRWSWLLAVLWAVQVVPWVIPPNSPFNILNWPPLLYAFEQFFMWGSVISVQIYRYVRVSDPVQRQQTKWFVYGTSIWLLLNPVYLVLPSIIPAFGKPNSIYQLLNGTEWELTLAIIPITIGIAILRYRLWDINVVINRTLVYGALTASILSIYILIVFGLGTLLQSPYNPFLSLLATGLIAVLFQPLREKLQHRVNRLLYGDRDDPYAVLARLGSQLEATLLPENVLPTIVKTIAQTLKLPYVAIALATGRQSSTDILASEPVTVLEPKIPDIVASYGEPLPNVMPISLIYQAETIGYLLLAARAGETFGKSELRLLTDLARQAGVAVYAVHLTTDLQRLSASLQQVREHLVAIREEERRRLRRDLHDGLGQALASIAVKVDATRNLFTHNTQRAETLLIEVRQQAQEAIDDIRRLVDNLRPPALDELGLLSVLREQVARSQHQGLIVDVDLPSSLPLLPAAVEVAVYRIIQEALTNVTRHANARHCLLRLSIDTQILHLEVSDDGEGIPTEHRIGVGLHSIHERASELGGSCVIVSNPSSGTTIRIRLPLEGTMDTLTPSAN